MVRLIFASDTPKTSLIVGIAGTNMLEPIGLASAFPLFD